MASKLFHLLLITCLAAAVTSVAAVNATTDALPGCQPKCGDINVPYPFGIGANCSIAPHFNVSCNTTLGTPRPYVAGHQVISFSYDEVRITNSIAATCYNQSGGVLFENYFAFDFKESPYTISPTKNKVTGIGCDTVVAVIGDAGSNYSRASGCISYCEQRQDAIDGECSGSGCCQTSLPLGMKYIDGAVVSIYNYTEVWDFNHCGAGFLAEEDTYRYKFIDSYENLTSLEKIPIVLNFGVGSQTCHVAKQNPITFACKDNSDCHNEEDREGYVCRCNHGYTGNPYLDPGCQDINECNDPNGNTCAPKAECRNTNGSYTCSCRDGYEGDGRNDGSRCIRKVPMLQLILGLGFGFLFLIVGGFWLYLIIKKRKLIKLKEKFFQQNGGLLLKQQISSLQSGSAKSTIFTAKELKLATNNYNQNRILGEGASGTVYKGVLPDLGVVAIKKSKIVDKSQLGQFINELVILTQINHRNVVKLFGCCLETEVPMLVYEYVSNGTLFQYLHNKSGEMSPISWRDRLRIAAEIASSLAYLHSAASTPIIHRDVKSANILLDNNYTAKMADFGASRLNPMNETQISTLVQGTMGYLDPEYFQTGQLTDKSDVYSFGVVLAELLTGERPISYDRSQTTRILATYFVTSVSENRLSELLDADIVNQGDVMEQVNTAAKLARRCLNLLGDDRPSMKEVAAELEGLGGFQKRSAISLSYDEKASTTHEHGDLYDPISLNSSLSPTDGSTSLGGFQKEMMLPAHNIPQ